MRVETRLLTGHAPHQGRTIILALDTEPYGLPSQTTIHWGTNGGDPGGAGLRVHMSASDSLQVIHQLIQARGAVARAVELDAATLAPPSPAGGAPIPGTDPEPVASAGATAEEIFALGQRFGESIHTHSEPVASAGEILDAIRAWNSAVLSPSTSVGERDLRWANVTVVLDALVAAAQRQEVAR